MRALLLSILLLASAFSMGEEGGWKLNLRTLAIVDYFQTTEFVFRTPGIYEKNRVLRGANNVEAAIYLAAETEGAIWVIDRLPRKYRDFASTLATLVRALPVLGNSKLGARHNYSLYVPLIRGNF